MYKFTWVRGHHLWLLRGIMERGGSASQLEFSLPDEYSHKNPEIRQHCRDIYLEIKQNPYSIVVVIDSLDDICTKCPNSDGLECKKYPRSILEMCDTDAINEFGLIYSTYSSREIVKRLKNTKH